ncbi:MAG: hypothetical protein AB8C02_10545 [Halioglobus sp.]
MAMRQHEAGVTVTRDAFRARMESQCHHIEQYRQKVLRETGREMTPDEAAVEWIERYAATFEHVDEASCA